MKWLFSFQRLLALGAVLVGCSALAACGSDQRRPEGPPPEYEPRSVVPWPSGAITGDLQTPEPAPEADAVEPPPGVSGGGDGGMLPAALCCDAGVR